MKFLDETSHGLQAFGLPGWPLYDGPHHPNSHNMAMIQVHSAECDANPGPNSVPDDLRYHFSRELAPQWLHILFHHPGLSLRLTSLPPDGSSISPIRVTKESSPLVVQEEQWSTINFPEAHPFIEDYLL